MWDPLGPYDVSQGLMDDFVFFSLVNLDYDQGRRKKIQIRVKITRIKTEPCLKIVRTAPILFCCSLKFSGKTSTWREIHLSRLVTMHRRPESIKKFDEFAVVSQLSGK